MERHSPQSEPWRGFALRSERPTAEYREAENRLVSVTIIATGHRSEFGYDGFGKRVEVIEKDPDANQVLQITSDKKYLWAGLEIAEERDSTGANVTKRFYSQGFVDTDGTVLFYTRDHLGSIRELTDSTQAVRARFDYDPWGRQTQISGDKTSVFGYTGMFWHSQSGLNIAMFRAYDPNLGRWISRDPIKEAGGVNLYGYVWNNPISYIDPLGLSGWPSTYPANPGGLPPGWTQDPNHGGPNNPSRWYPPDGPGGLEFHPADPSAAPGSEAAKDHWHDLVPDPNKPGKNKKDKDHHDPGEPCKDPNPEPTPETNERSRDPQWPWQDGWDFHKTPAGWIWDNIIVPPTVRPAPAPGIPILPPPILPPVFI